MHLHIDFKLHFRVSWTFLFWIKSIHKNRMNSQNAVFMLRNIHSFMLPTTAFTTWPVLKCHWQCQKDFRATHGIRWHVLFCCCFFCLFSVQNDIEYALHTMNGFYLRLNFVSRSTVWCGPNSKNELLYDLVYNFDGKTTFRDAIIRRLKWCDLKRHSVRLMLTLKTYISITCTLPSLSVHMRKK